MYYGTTQLATDFTEEMMRDWKVLFLKTLLFFIPRANSQVEKLYPRVRSWVLEVGDDGIPQREIGLDCDGLPLFRTPDEINTGFWTDMAAKEFAKEELQAIDGAEFERLWNLAGEIVLEPIKPHILVRLFFAALLGFFAYIPTYIFGYFLINVLSRASFGEMADGAMVIAFILSLSGAIAYLLWLLAWRALSWTSSRRDGHLLPPFAMKAVVSVFGIIGACIVVYSLYVGEYLKTVGSLLYMVVAAKVFTSYRVDPETGV